MQGDYPSDSRVLPFRSPRTLYILSSGEWLPGSPESCLLADGWIWLLARLYLGCSAVLRGCVRLGRYDLRTETFLSFLGVCLGLLLVPSSWPQTNILPGRSPFYLLLCQPKGLAGCTAFPLGFVNCADGSPVPSLSFLTLWLRPRILQFLTRFEEFSVLSLDDFVGDDRRIIAVSHLYPREIPVQDRAVLSRY